MAVSANNDVDARVKNNSFLVSIVLETCQLYTLDVHLVY